MEKVKGRILNNGIVVADNIEISLTHILPTTHSFGEWYGTYLSSDLLDFDSCILEFEDGRKGKIIITSNHEFKGTGPLK